MPRLADDRLYERAFEVASRIQDEELLAFRRRLARRVVSRVTEALDAMGSTFDEAALRRALAGYERMYVEESMAYIRATLVRGGEIEVAKRLAEVAEKVGLEDLPEPFRSGYEELQRSGSVARVTSRSPLPLE